MTQARPPAGRKKKWPWVAGAAGSVVLIAGAVSAGKPAEEAVIQPAAAVVETSVSTTTVTTTVISTSVVTSPVTQTVTADPSPVTVTVTAAAAAAAVEAPATPAPAPLAAIPSTTKAPTTSAKPEPASGGSTYYKNCAAVWAAGKAPIHAGDPGYSTDLDGDSDGVGCEKPPR